MTTVSTAYPPGSVESDPCNIEAAKGIYEALTILGGRWKMKILFHLAQNEVMRFSEIDKAIPKIAQKVLTAKLKELQNDGIIGRVVYPEVPPKVEYHLTEVGKALCPSLKELHAWAKLRKRFIENAASMNLLILLAYFNIEMFIFS